MEHEEKHEYKALRSYQLAIEYLTQGLEYEKDAKAKEYLARVEQLNTFLQSQGNKPQVEGLQSVGLATNPANTGKDGDGNTSEHRSPQDMTT